MLTYAISCTSLTGSAIVYLPIGKWVKLFYRRGTGRSDSM